MCILMGIKSKLKDQEKVNVAAVQILNWHVFLPLPTTTSLECNEREIIVGIRK